MNRRLLLAATLLTCSAPALTGCGESGGVSSTPVKGKPAPEGASFQPQVPPTTPAAPAAGTAPAGKRQLAPTDTVE